MAVKFINLNKGGTTVSFNSSQDFPLGSPIFFKLLGTGTYLTNNSTTVTVTSTHGLTIGTQVYLYIDFLSGLVLDDYFLVNITSINTFTFTIPNASILTGSLNFYDWSLGISGNEASLPEYVVSAKNGIAPFSYTAIKLGEIILTTNQWDVIKESGSGGLIPGKKYYSSLSIAGKITDVIPPLNASVLRAITTTKAFVDFSLKTAESGTGSSFLREVFTGNNSSKTFTLSKAPAGQDYCWVYIGGVYQIPSSSWSLSGASIVFTDAPPLNSTISVHYARAMLLADSNAVNKMVAFSETVTVSAKTIFNLPAVPANISSAIVFVGGAIQTPSQFNISESLLIFLDPVPVGVQVVVYILNSSGIMSGLDSYALRKTISIPTSNSFTLSDLFGSQVSASYRFFDKNDPRISGTIYLKHNGTGIDPDIRVDSNSSKVSVSQISPLTLNHYISSNLLRILNNTGATLNLVYYREL
jgi:hypothetical protein